ncbi:MAG TPA: hypothetical protein VGZ24_02860 [Chthoniobacterales bacterium]|jgi:hypothetical protein|nr:hypothetical protein [Chthoniobacterales bacterium]
MNEEEKTLIVQVKPKSGEKRESILQRIKASVISQGKEWTPELEKKFKAGIQVWFPN